MAGFPGPGDRIEARCTRCNDVTGHVIVALVGGQIVKVECRACGSVHKYYPPQRKKEAGEKKTVYRVKAGEDRKDAVTAARPEPVSAFAGREARSERGAASRPSAKSQRVAEEIAQSWQRSLNSTLATPRPYAMDAAFAVGDVVEHPVFGQGVVSEVLPPDKMQVLFRDGPRLLRCGNQ